jgi:hypothetical protein
MCTYYLFPAVCILSEPLYWQYFYETSVQSMTKYGYRALWIIITLHSGFKKCSDWKWDKTPSTRNIFNKQIKFVLTHLTLTLWSSGSFIIRGLNKSKGTAKMWWETQRLSNKNCCSYGDVLTLLILQLRIMFVILQMTVSGCADCLLSSLRCRALQGSSSSLEMV